MKRILIAAAFALAAGGVAYAQDTAPQPDAGNMHPPESRMDQATPQMTAPGGAQEELAPTNRVGDAVPPMKAAEPEDSTSTAQTSPGSSNLVLTEDEAKNWLGRTVFSSDGKKLGTVAALRRDTDNRLTDLYADIGGFLGFGETRVHIAADQVKDVKPDGIVLTLSEAEANKLPGTDAPAAQ